MIWEKKPNGFYLQGDWIAHPSYFDGQYYAINPAQGKESYLSNFPNPEATLLDEQQLGPYVEPHECKVYDIMRARRKAEERKRMNY